MGTKYTYSEGTTYQSENTPITISKIPTGEYTINAVKGGIKGEVTVNIIPGTQDVTVRLGKILVLENTGWITAKIKVDGSSGFDISSDTPIDAGTKQEFTVTADTVVVAIKKDTSENIPNKSISPDTASFKESSASGVIYFTITNLASKTTFSFYMNSGPA